MALTRRPFLTKPYPPLILLRSAIGTKTPVMVLMVFVAYGFGLVTPISWAKIGLAWIYFLACVFIEDWAKLHLYHYLKLACKRHRKFLDQVKRPLQSPAW